jgi:hypothetical protein
MKTNVALHNKIGFQQPSEKVWYTAHVLKAALSNSAAVPLFAAVPNRAAKPAVVAQTAKPARAATAAVTAANNTTGYGFGELYLNSPAYPIGTAIPAIGAKSASAAVAAADAIAAQAASPAISSPAVVALTGWSDAISIVESSANDELTVTAQLPVTQGVGIVGSNKLVIGEITPTALQATNFVGGIVYALGQDTDVQDNPEDTTLEQVFWRNALLCDHVITDTTRTINGVVISCKTIVVTLYPSGDYQFGSNQLQLDDIRMVANSGS